MAVKETAVMLNRKVKLWACKNCKKTSESPLRKCQSCGGEEYTEAEVPLPEDMPRKNFKVLTNLLYEGKQYNTGTIVSLVEDDIVTRGMIKNELIREASIKGGKKK